MSLEKMDAVRITGKYIIFTDEGASESGKTRVFDVGSTHDGSHLGEVRWFGRWRRYAFYPAAKTVFEQICMRDISNFIELRLTGDDNGKLRRLQETSTANAPAATHCMV